MLAVTFKSILKCLRNCDWGAEIVLSCKPFENGEQYSFVIKNKEMFLIKTVNGIQHKESVVDEESLQLPNVEVQEITKTTYLKDTDKIYDKYIVMVHYDAQLFVMACKILKERAQFRIRHNGKLFDAHYVDGKLYYADYVEDEIILYATDLFELNKVMEGYEVIYMGNLDFKLSGRTLRERYEAAAKISNRRLVKYRDGQRI